MKIRRISAAVALTAAGALTISGCTAGTGNTDDSGLVEGSSVTVAANAPFYSYNGRTSFGGSAANGNITYLTLDDFNYGNNTPELVPNTSFGSYEMLDEDPLTVKYTVAEEATWSDGTPVDAADLLLQWAALSRSLDTPDFDVNDYVDPDSGAFTDSFPTDVVYFDSGASPAIGLGLVSQTPEVSDDLRSITMVYDAPYVDWEVAFPAPLPAHVVAKKALGIEDNEEAKQAVIDAIQDEDDAALAPISSFWNSGFNFTELPDDPELYLASGPYMISDFAAGEYVTLVANPEYKGEHQPNIEEITFRFIADPLAAVQALENGEVDVIAPQATADIKTAVDALDGVTVLAPIEPGFEHIDLQFENGKNPENIFSNPTVREAFLKTIPRQEILEKLIVPIAGEDALLRGSYVLAPGVEGYDETVENNGSEAFDEVDIEGAKALLAESGVTDTSVCILYAANNPRRVNEFALIQASANQAGFNVTDCGSTEFSGQLGSPGAYDASLFASQPFNLGVTGNLPSFRTGTAYNYSFFSNERADEIISELGLAFDAETRVDLQLELDKILFDEYFGLTLFQFPGVTAFSDRLEGIDPAPLPPQALWNAWDWTMTDSSLDQ